MMINFNEAEEKINKFLGSEKKTTILYNGEIYMLKYPDPVRSDKFKENLSYKNNQFSEYIGSRIFKSCGFNTQDTLLGYFTDVSGKEKTVVACKDFTQDGSTLYEFAKVANQTLVDKSIRNSSIEDVYSIVEEASIIKDKNEVIAKFWDMFVVDALIGNRDRHFGNWGLLETNGELSFAPIYDCGSSLSALLDDENMEAALKAPAKIKEHSFNVTSCYLMNGKRVVYHEIFAAPPQDLADAIKRIVPHIDMDKVTAIINDTPAMSDVRKKYLIKAVDMRYTQIILPALKRIQSKEKTE
jgi:hypothetical protein